MFYAKTSTKNDDPSNKMELEVNKIHDLMSSNLNIPKHNLLL